VILLFTDFGAGGPYVGQMKAVLARAAPEVPVVDLMADLPAFDARAAAYLLAALAGDLAPGDVVVGVVDPGVGGARDPVVVAADGRWFVGPDNGLFELVLRRAGAARWWTVSWTPARLSASFHGRDLFAPVAARLARGGRPPGSERPLTRNRRQDWPDDLAEVVYVDRFGNAMTGVRAAAMAPDARLEVGGREIPAGRTFSDVAEGQAFWYENAIGLVEIAVNRGRADRALGLAVGVGVDITT